MSTPWSQGAHASSPASPTHSLLRERSGRVTGSLNSAGDIWVWQNEALQKLARNWGKIWNFSLEIFQKEDHLVLIKVSLAPSFSSALSLSLPQARPCQGHGLLLLNFPRIREKGHHCLLSVAISDNPIIATQRETSCAPWNVLSCSVGPHKLDCESAT